MCYIHFQESAVYSQTSALYISHCENSLYILTFENSQKSVYIFCLKSLRYTHSQTSAVYSQTSALYIALRENSLYILTFENSQENSQNIQNRQTPSCFTKHEGGLVDLKRESVVLRILRILRILMRILRILMRILRIYRADLQKKRGG